jgi:hypothetical protein
MTGTTRSMMSRLPTRLGVLSVTVSGRRGHYGTSFKFEGVWLSDRPLDQNDGAEVMLYIQHKREKHNEVKLLTASSAGTLMPYGHEE